MSRRIYDPNSAAFASSLRKSMTKAEACLWKYALRAGTIKGYGFHRQWPMFGYIADFYCAELKLIIEVDGAGHGTPEQQAYDLLRSKHLQAEGFRVVRFKNAQVLEHMVSLIAFLEDLVVEFEQRKGDWSREIWSHKR